MPVNCKFLFTFSLSFARPGIWGNEGTRCSIPFAKVKSDRLISELHCSDMIEHDGAGYLDGLADAYEQGLVKAVGVSNYNGLYHVFSLQK